MSRIILSKRIGKSYKRNASIIVLLLLFFFMSNVIFANVGTIKSTPYPKSFTQNGLDITYVEGGLDTKSNQLYVAFSIPFNQIDPLLEFQVLAKNDVKTNRYLESNVVKIFEDYYVGYVQLPKGKWEKIALEITQAGDADSSLSGSSGEKIILYRKGLTGQQLSKNYFQKSYYVEKIAMEDKAMKEKKQEEKELNQAIEKAEKTIQGLEESKKSSPESEQEAIQLKITEAKQIVEQKNNAVTELAKKRDEKIENKKHYEETLSSMD